MCVDNNQKYSRRYKNADPNKLSHDVASDQGFHCLLLICSIKFENTT